MTTYYKLDHSEPGYQSQMLPRADGKWIKRADYEADHAAARAEIERLTKVRDHEAVTREGILQKRINDLLARAEKAEAERDKARSMLADAERDMRQRAADVCDRNDQVSGWVSRDAILALPLKHADREGGV